jgi:thiol-disulfide isomerase/thioredoxin
MGSLHTILTSQIEWINVRDAITQRKLDNRVIYVDSWTSCCINCVNVLPALKKLEKNFGWDISAIGIHCGKLPNETQINHLYHAVLKRPFAPGVIIIIFPSGTPLV